MSDDHIYTSDFKKLSRELSRKGIRNPGVEAMKRLGIERSVKRKYHDDYLEKKMRKP